MSGKKAIEPQDAYVLVVEDNLQNMVLISRLLDFLEVKNYEWKASGWQMMEVVETMPRVDLILLDLHLPYEDGYDLISKIRAHPKLAEARVIAVTADAHSKAMNKAKEAGFDGFLGKPIDPNTFPEQITAILQGEEVWSLGL